MGIHMMRTIDLRGQQLSTRDLLALIPRAGMDVAVTMDAARALIDEVRTGGAAALVAQAERFDRVRPAHIRVPIEQLREAEAALDPRVRAALESTITRVRRGRAGAGPAPRGAPGGPGGGVWAGGGNGCWFVGRRRRAAGGFTRRSRRPRACSGLRRCTPWAARARLARSRTGCLRLTWSPCSGWLVPATCSLPQPSALCRASPGLTRRRGPQTSSSLPTIVPTPISLRRI